MGQSKQRAFLGGGQKLFRCSFRKIGWWFGYWDTKLLGADSTHLWRTDCVGLTWPQHTHHLLTVALLWEYLIVPFPEVLKIGADGESVVFVAWEEKQVLLQVLQWETYLESFQYPRDVLYKLMGGWRNTLELAALEVTKNVKLHPTPSSWHLLSCRRKSWEKYALVLPR